MHARKSICCKIQWHSFAQKVFSKVPCTQYCAKYLWGDMRDTRLDMPSRSFQSSTWIREQSGRNLWVPQTPEEDEGEEERASVQCWLLAGGSFLFGLLQKLTDNTATGSPQSKTEGVREPRREGERKYDQERHHRFFVPLSWEWHPFAFAALIL